MRRKTILLLCLVVTIRGFQSPEISSPEKIIQANDVIGNFIEFDVGEDIKLSCTNPNNEELEFYFPNLTDFKNYDPVDSALRRDESDGTFGAELVIRNAKMADIGTYTCAVKNQISLASHVYVFVKGNETFVPMAVSGFSVDPTNYVVPCKASKNVMRGDVHLKVNGEVWKSAAKHYDPRFGFNITEKTAENKLSTQLMYSCFYPKTEEHTEFFISPKSTIDKEKLSLEWGEVTEWPYVGGDFAMECILKFPDKKSMEEKHKHFINITCPRCDSGDVIHHTRLRQRGSARDIQIMHLTAEDRGKYVCTWYYDLVPQQNISRIVDVSNKEGQIKIFEKSPQDVFVKQGGKFNMFANLTFYPSGISGFSANWIRVYSKPPKDEKISETVITDTVHNQDSNVTENMALESLSMKDAAVNMSGIYVLTMKVKDTVKTIEYNVSVFSEGVKARIEIMTPESYVLFDQKYYPRGKQLRVLCYVEAFPLARVRLMYKIAAVNDGWLDVDPDHLIYLNGTFESSLQWDTTPKSSIDVKCTGERNDSWDSEEKRIRVSNGNPNVASTVVRSAAATELEDSKDIYEGDNVILNCTFPKDGEWSSKWLFGSNEVSNSQITTGDLSQMHIATLRNISASAAGEYSCKLKNENHEKTLKLKLNVIKTMKPFHTESDKEFPTVLRYGMEATLKCHLSGLPKPQINWYKDNKPYTGGFLKDDNRTLVISRVAIEDKGEFLCRAQNRAGNAESTFQTIVEGGPKKSSSLWMTILVLALLVLLCCICGFLFVIVKQRRTNKNQNRALEVLYDQLMREQSTPLPLGPKQPIDQRIGDLPYKREFDLDREALFIGKRIGTGQFGQVFSGHVTISKVSDASHEDTKVPVAIKAPLNGRNPTHQKMLADELKIMCAIGRHPNVLSLLGAVTKNMKNGEFYVVVELCDNGNLKDYLLARRTSIINELREADVKNDGYVVPNSVQRSRYANELDAKWSEEAETERLLPDSMTLTTSDLLSFSMQVANGMDYLSSIPCIHRDLAARNVLITGNSICRIADFGMARNENKDYYKVRKGKNIPVPYRWMSIEAIEQGIFTQESDIWAYGILLYEVFSLSGLPYPTISNEELLETLKAGHRNSKPQHCHEEIYQLMMRCWDENSSARPNFNECVQLLKSHLNLSSPQLLERVETEIVKEVTKQNNISKWLRPEEDYREQARNGLSRQNEGSGRNEHVYLHSFN